MIYLIVCATFESTATKNCYICDSVQFSYKMLIGILVISLDENCTI